MPSNENFDIVEVQIPGHSDGEILVRNTWMSVDPLEGGCVYKVIESKNNQFAVGDYVLRMKGWREYWISDGNPASSISKVDPNTLPIRLIGHTAYVGLLRIGQLKEGETVFVAAASGTVGSVVCQIAKVMLCDRKCWLKRKGKSACQQCRCRLCIQL